MAFNDEKFLDEKYPEKHPQKDEYVHFLPVWSDQLGWKFKSLKTGRTYMAEEFLVQPYNPSSRFAWYFVRYHAMVDETVFQMSPSFVTSWLKLCLSYEAMEHREKARLKYLAEHVGEKNVHRNSEKVYQEEYGRYFEKFANF
jgi:hypothetical protein